MAGIREIAKKAGVSISTASYALNGSDKISQATRDRVLDIAKKVGYTPKLAARTLKGGKTNIIGVYIRTFQGDFYGELLDSMQHTLEVHGYDMIVTSGLRARNFLPEKLLDGAIVLDSQFTDAQLNGYLAAGSKIVVMDRQISHPNARAVLLDNSSGSEQAVAHLLSLKSDRYYIIAGPEGNYDARVRLEVAQHAFEKGGTRATVLPGDFTEASGVAAAAEILKQTPAGTVGIYSLNDNSAVGFYRYMAARKLDISERFYLVGFDNNHSADFLKPILPSVTYHKHHWGEVAASTLVALLDKADQVEDQFISTRLGFREDTIILDEP